MGKIRVVNPKKEGLISLETATMISRWIEDESRGYLSNMLPQDPKDLLGQMKKGLSCLAVSSGKIIGHVTLWRYSLCGWGEAGSLIVSPDFQGRGVGKKLIRYFIGEFSDSLRVTATVKTEPARKVFLSGGFKEISFMDLMESSEEAWRECCPCHNPPGECPKQGKSCKLMVFSKNGFF